MPLPPLVHCSRNSAIWRRFLRSIFDWQIPESESEALHQLSARQVVNYMPRRTIRLTVIDSTMVVGLGAGDANVQWMANDGELAIIARNGS